MQTNTSETTIIITKNINKKISYAKVKSEIIKLDKEPALSILHLLEKTDGNESTELLDEIEQRLKAQKDDIEDITIYNSLQKRIETLRTRIGRQINDNFGTLIRSLRNNHGYSLKDVANITGISASYINRLEKFDRKAPSFKILEALAKALDVSVSILIEAAGIKNDKKGPINMAHLLFMYDIEVSNIVLTAEQKLKMYNMAESIIRFNEVIESNEVNHKHLNKQI
ncbi:MAG: putative transcriptional regulator [Herbinix sp.]|jgi:transcriptional regulator with XRE-family HTH domain|nr:putative transcriptional regulator [Herbinix sp.]